MTHLELPLRDHGKPTRAGGRGGRGRSGARPYARRRRPAAPVVAQAGVLRQFWDEHAVKAGISAFGLWFVAVNWQGLQMATASLFSVVNP